MDRHYFLTIVIMVLFGLIGGLNGVAMYRKKPSDWTSYWLIWLMAALMIVEDFIQLGNK